MSPSCLFGRNVVALADYDTRHEKWFVWNRHARMDSCRTVPSVKTNVGQSSTKFYAFRDETGD